MRRHPAPLDDDTVDRLLRRRLDPADAPPGYAATTRLLRDAGEAHVADEIDPDLIGSMVRAITSSPPTPTEEKKMPSKLLTAKIATLAAGAILVTAGAAAATGNLPGPAQDAVSHAVSHVGVNVPDSSSDHPTGNTTNSTDADQHGVDVATAAHNTETTGKNHGADVSAVAKANHGHDTTDTTEATDATDHGKPADPGSQAPVATPNPGGTGTADTASGGHSEVGTSHASSHASAGSANADDNPGSSHH